MKTLSLYGVVTITMLALASPLYAVEDITKPKDDENVKALTGADEEEKVGKGPADPGKYEVDVDAEKKKEGKGRDLAETEDITKPKDDKNVKALTGKTDKGKVGMGPSETGKYHVDTGAEKAMTVSKSRDELTGMEVLSKDGEQIGEIGNIYPSDESKAIQYVTLSNVGDYGIGKQNDIAVPLAALTFETDRARLTVDESKLKDAPMQAELSDENFQQKLQKHYGISPEWQEKSN